MKLKGKTPRIFDEVVGHNDLINGLKYDIKNKIKKAYLFYGDYGTGKTMLTNLYLKYKYGVNYKKNPNVLILNASEKTQKEFYITNVLPFLNTKGFNNQSRTIVLDECEQISPDAQKQLKGFIDKFKKITWFFITNHISKMDGGIMDRADIYQFKKPTKDDILLNLKRVCEVNNITIKEETLENIIYQSESHRKAIILLESYLATSEDISIEVHEEIPIIESESIIEKMELEKKALKEKKVRELDEKKVEVGDWKRVFNTPKNTPKTKQKGDSEDKHLEEHFLRSLILDEPAPKDTSKKKDKNPPPPRRSFL